MAARFTTTASVLATLTAGPFSGGVFTTRATAIVVSGYAAVVAQQVYLNGAPYLAAQSGFTWRPPAPGTPAPFLTAGRDDRAATRWCAKCRRTVPRDATDDGRLGYRGYCDACVARLAARCVAVAGRLPAPGEAYCAPGNHVVKASEMCARERDGRRRLKCRDCRTRELRERRRARRAA